MSSNTGSRLAAEKATRAANGAASRRTIVLLFGSFARSGHGVNKVCKEKRTVATVPLLIRSNYSRAKRSIRTASNFSTTTVGRAFNNVRQGENVRDGIKRFENQTERRTEVSVLVRFIFLFHFTLRLFWKKDKGGNGREDNAAWMSGRVSEPIPSRACFPGSWTRRKEKEKRQRGRNGDESRRKNSLAWDRDEDE